MNLKIILVITIIAINTAACSPLAQPTQDQITPGLTTYNITAVPTIFAKPPQTAPSVKLNWASANRQVLKIDLTVTGLDPKVNVSDLVCDPYLLTKPAIQYDSSPGRDVKPLTDQPGNPLELTYQYSLHPNEYKSIDIEMDVTIGPCADYLNFQETNVTPSAIPDLLGNYHFSFRVPVQ